MGYNTRPEQLDQNIALLERILSKERVGETLRLKVPEDANISTEQYRVRRLLAATDNHRTAHGGKFAGLGSRVNVKSDPIAGEIKIVPKALRNLEEFRASEREAIDVLIEAKGSIVMVEFWPSPFFEFETFSKDAARAGWLVLKSTMEKSEDGKLTFAAEKIEEEETGGFGALAGDA